MSRIKLKDEVQRAIRSEWPAFVVNHPRLAEILDEDLLIEHAVETLRNDAEYQETMKTAVAANIGAEVVRGVIVRLVGKFLRRLI